MTGGDRTGGETGDNKRCQRRPPSPADDAVQPVPVGGHPGVDARLVCPPAPVTPAGNIYTVLLTCYYMIHGPDDAEQRGGAPHRAHHRAAAVPLAAVHPARQEPWHEMSVSTSV